MNFLLGFDLVEQLLQQMLDPSAISAFFQVLMVDLVLAGDNAIVVGMAAAGLPAEHRRKAILLGIAAAAILRIAFAAVTAQLLAIIGLTLAGGVLLAWVAWKMWREIQAQKQEDQGAEIAADEAEGDTAGASAAAAGAPTKTLRQALTQIVVADVSMSLDNVLAVAGAAREHPYILVFGLALSVVLMGVASTLIARLLSRYHWIAYIGLAMIAYIALEMIYKGGREVLAHIG